MAAPACCSAFHDISAHREALSALRGARAAADEANAAKSRFLATMSHEIRTPLYGVVSTLELLGLTRSMHASRVTCTPSAVPPMCCCN